MFNDASVPGTVTYEKLRGYGESGKAPAVLPVCEVLALTACDNAAKVRGRAPTGEGDAMRVQTYSEPRNGACFESAAERPRRSTVCFLGQYDRMCAGDFDELGLPRLLLLLRV